MKRLFFLIVIVTCNYTSSLANNWYTSFEEAQKLALGTGKLMLVDFWASWCGPCKKMDKESWSQDDVKLLMDNFIPVQINIDVYISISKRYNVRGIPYVFIMDGNGVVLYQSMSYKSKSDVIALLKRFSIHMDFLNTELINNYKKDNFANTFRLALKYVDFSHYVNNNVKKNVLKAANTYMDVAEKKLKKSELKNKEKFSEKIELYRIKEQLILNKTKKAIKKLQNYDLSNVQDMNKPLFCILKYVSYKLTGDNKNAESWKLYLKEDDILKAKLFFKT